MGTSASNQFGREPEGQGVKAIQSLSSLPKGLVKPLQSLTPVDLLRPVPYGDILQFFN